MSFLENRMTEQLKTILSQRLVDKGIGHEAIPGFIRSLRHVFAVYPFISHCEVNRIMNFLGWNNIELDGHTLKLLITDSGFSPRRVKRRIVDRKLTRGRVVACSKPKSTYELHGMKSR